MSLLLFLTILILHVINHADCYQTTTEDYPVDVWGESIGCFDIKISWGKRLFTDSSMTYNTCWKYCQKQDASFAGLTNGNSCFCSNSDVKTVPVDAATKCNQDCAGNSFQKCGSQNGVSFFGIRENPNRLREVIKNMEQKNIYVHRKNDVQWLRYNQDAIDLQPVELTRNQNSVFAFIDTCAATGNAADCFRAYVELTGSVDIIYGVAPCEQATPTPSITQIHAIWDIVFAINKRELANSNNEVIYHRKTQCVWVEKINGEITYEFKLASPVQMRGGQFSVVLRSVNLPIETVTLGSNYLIQDNGSGKQRVYKGKWFNVAMDNLEDYFLPDLFKCDQIY